MIGARVRIMLKRSVLDPQGAAVVRSLRGLGYEDVRDVRVGKVIELVLDTVDEDEAREQIQRMCTELLANSVIESWDVELVDAASVGGLQEVAGCV